MPPRDSAASLLHSTSRRASARSRGSAVAQHRGDPVTRSRRQETDVEGSAALDLRPAPLPRMPVPVADDQVEQPVPQDKFLVDAVIVVFRQFFNYAGGAHDIFGISKIPVVAF